VHDEFSIHVNPWFSLMAANTRESRTLAELRDLLLPRLLSGEIRVRQAEKARNSSPWPVSTV
jgi:type I restriction enzyme S subunit